MAFTKVVGAGIHTQSNIVSHNINSAGIITATKFDGPFDNIVIGGGGLNISGVVTSTGLDVNGNGDISGNLVVGGNLTANGDFTTLNTTLREVELLRVDASDSAIAGIITQSGSGNALYVDGTTILGNNQYVPSLLGSTQLVVSQLSGNTNSVDMTILGGRAGKSIIRFGDQDSNNRGSLQYHHSNESINFYNNGNASDPRLTIATGGSVGIGSTSPDYPLDVAGSIGFSGQTRGLTQSASTPTYSFDGDSDTGMYRGNGVNILSFATAGVERLKIDADGAINIGHNPDQSTGTNTQNAILTLKGYPGGNESSAAILALIRGYNTTSATTDHTLGRIVFGDKQAGEYAFIEGEVEANGGSVGDTPGRLVFSTADDGTSAPTEKLRISSNGGVCIGSGYKSGGGGHLTIRGGGINSYACQDYQYVGTPSDDDTLAQIRFTANTSGSSVIQGAVIKAVADADWGTSGDSPTRLEFHTAPDGSASMVNRMTITQDGRIGMHDSTPNDYELDIMKRSTATDANMRLYNNATGSTNDTVLRLHIAGTSANNFIYFGDGDDSNIGQIRYRHSNDNLIITTGAAERLAINSAGITVTGEVAATQDYPNQRPALDFNFAQEKVLDPRLMFARDGDGSYYDEFGLVRIAGRNEPRFDHDQFTRESKGLLMEEARTNYIKYGNGDRFTSQGSIGSITEGWGQQSTTNSTLTQFAALGPDGTMSALKYTLNATTGRRFDYEGLSTTNGTVYCYSWWMKRLNSGSLWRFQQVGGSGVTNEQILIDGVAASGQTSGYTPPDDEWHRVTWRFTKTNTETMDLGGYDDSGGTGDRWLLWGAQFEAGIFPTSYIPTDGAEKTRYQDTMRMTGDDVANIYNNTEGTMFYEASVTDLTNDNQPIVAFRDQSNATGNEIAMGYRTGGGSSGNIRTWMRSYVTGSQVNSFLSNHSSTGLVGGKPYKHIFGFKKDDAADSYNTGENSSQATDSNGNLPVADSIDELRFGAYYSSITTYSLESGHIKRFSYWPVRLTNAQLTTYIS